MKQRILIGEREIGKRPYVVGVISAQRTVEHLQVDQSLPFDIAEFRIDLIGVDCPGWMERVSQLTEAGYPVILTVRHAHEGGHWYRDEAERADVYRTALPYVSAIDVEIQSELIEPLVQEAHALKKCVIGSFHEFTKTPASETLNAIIREGRQKGVDIVKMATMIQTPADAERLMGLLSQTPDTHLCLLGMGPLGVETRVTFPLAGSCLTYGYVDQASAPGQLSSVELKKRLEDSTR